MKQFNKLALAILSLSLISSPSFAFSLTFKWGDLRLCTNGKANKGNANLLDFVQNQTFIQSTYSYTCKKESADNGQNI